MFIHSFQKVVRGVARACLHFFSRMAGTPSAPEAAEDLSSSIASIISFSCISMLLIGRLLSSIVGGVVDGELNTESYWLASRLAISTLSAVILSVALFISGPTFVFTLLCFFA